MKPIWIFVLGGILSPLILTFGKLIVFAVGLGCIAWVAYTVNEVFKEEEGEETCSNS